MPPRPLTIPKGKGHFQWLRLKYTQDSYIPWTPWKVEIPVYFLLFVSICILVPLLWATQGYELVTQTSANYTHVPDHWYYRFTRTPEPGSLCDRYPLGIGESFVTTFGFFSWALISVLPSTNSQDDSLFDPSTLLYGADKLDNCDVSAVSLAADSRNWDVMLRIQVGCNTPELGTFVFSTLQNLGLALDLSQAWTYSSGQNGTDPLGQAVRGLLTVAAQDVIEDLLNRRQVLGDLVSPAYIAVNTAEFPIYCPGDRQGDDFATTCIDTPPVLNINPYGWRPVLLNGSLMSSSDHRFGEWSAAPTSLIQLAVALARLDTGHDLPNNFLTNISAISGVIPPNYTISGFPTKTQSSQLYQKLTSNVESGILADSAAENKIVLNQSATIRAQYSCQNHVPRTRSGLLITIAVGLSSLLTTGWATAMSVIGFFACRYAEKAHKDAAAGGAATGGTATGGTDDGIDEEKHGSITSLPR